MKRNKKQIGTILIAIGIVLVLSAASLTAYNVWDADRADRAAQTAVKELEEKIEEAAEEDQPAGELSEEREMPTMEIDGYRYIGYLTVPSTGLNLPIMEDWDYDRLKIAPCRYSGTVYQNDMVLAGHNYRRHFSTLRWLELGTEIDFTDVEQNVYRYQISSVETLQPENIKDMTASSDDWDLTLFTCTIGGQARYTIRCVRI